MGLHSARSGRGFPWKLLFGGLVIAGLAVAAVSFDARRQLSEFLAALENLGIWAPLLFIALYVAATVLMAPGSVLTLGAGAAFGLVWGTLYVWIGATLGAGAAFLVGRYLARDWVGTRIAGHARFAAIDKAVEREGWKIVGLTRLSPVFPFNLLNYAFGLTGVRFLHYLGASSIGMLPGTILYVYLGFLARSATSMDGPSAAQWLFYGVGFTATFAVTVVITRLAKRALAKRSDLPNPLP